MHVILFWIKNSSLLAIIFPSICQDERNQELHTYGWVNLVRHFYELLLSLLLIVQNLKHAFQTQLFNKWNEVWCAFLHWRFSFRKCSFLLILLISSALFFCEKQNFYRNGRTSTLCGTRQSGEVWRPSCYPPTVSGYQTWWSETGIVIYQICTVARVE